MRRNILILLVLALVTGFTAVAQQKSSHIEDKVLAIINKYRQSKGLIPLTPVNIIAEQAKNHSRDMATGKVPFGHDGFEERTNILKDSLPGTQAGAENVAYGVTTAEAVVDMWLKSPEHKKNIEGKFNLTGIGVVKNSAGIAYFTEIFIRQRQ